MYMENINNVPIATGKWGESFSWEINLSPEVPPAELCTAVACVAITDLDTGEVVLTRNHRGWEILAGHIEDGESVLEALSREALEEGGFDISKAVPFGYRKVTSLAEPATIGREAKYPHPTSYIAYFFAYTNSPIQEITGEEIVESRTFAPKERDELAQAGELKEIEQLLIGLGLDAARQPHPPKMI